jgi:hypothetical protein
MATFINKFNYALKEGDLQEANAELMRELAAILVRDKADFVDMLNESGVLADVETPDAQLIELFVTNVGQNKKLMLNSALLVNQHNRKMGFDGEQELDDNLVKESYLCMKSCFTDEPIGENYSNIAPALLVPLIGAGVKLASKGVDAAGKRRSEKDQQKLAKQQMIEEARRRKEEEKRRLREEKEKREERRRKTMLYAGVGVTGLLIIGFIVYRATK